MDLSPSVPLSCLQERGKKKEKRGPSPLFNSSLFLGYFFSGIGVSLLKGRQERDFRSPVAPLKSSLSGIGVSLLKGRQERDFLPPFAPLKLPIFVNQLPSLKRRDRREN
jgi:hypothetical protein